MFLMISNPCSLSDPLPDINFKHPLTGRFASLKVQSLSGSGFSVEEDKAHSVLSPGLILPEIELSFANSFKIKCFVQVLYQQSMDGMGIGAGAGYGR